MDPEEDLAKFSHKEKEKILRVVKRLMASDTAGLNIKKLSGSNDLFRVRLGNIRIIYQRIGRKLVFLRFSRRNEKTYKF